MKKNGIVPNSINPVKPTGGDTVIFENPVKTADSFESKILKKEAVMKAFKK